MDQGDFRVRCLVLRVASEADEASGVTKVFGVRVK